MIHIEILNTSGVSFCGRLFSGTFMKLNVKQQKKSGQGINDPCLAGLLPYYENIYM